MGRRGALCQMNLGRVSAAVMRCAVVLNYFHLGWVTHLPGLPLTECLWCGESENLNLGAQLVFPTHECHSSFQVLIISVVFINFVKKKNVMI